jgi:hypothetical protein
VMTPWVYSGVPEADPWRPEDLTPPNPQYPFAVGIDPALLGAAVPDGWAPVTPDVRVLPGDSSQQLLVVERDPGTCSDQDTAGLVSTNGTVIGSVLWEGPSGSTDGRTRGWAIVPKSEPAAYEFWCRAS